MPFQAKPSCQHPPAGSGMLGEAALDRGRPTQPVELHLLWGRAARNPALHKFSTACATHRCRRRILTAPFDKLRAYVDRTLRQAQGA
jgi:hypothetical protein